MTCSILLGQIDPHTERQDTCANEHTEFAKSENRLGRKIAGHEHSPEECQEVEWSRRVSLVAILEATSIALISKDTCAKEQTE